MARTPAAWLIWSLSTPADLMSGVRAFLPPTGPVNSWALLATNPGLTDVRASVARVSTVGVGGNASPRPPGATHRSARSPPYGSASTTIVGSGVETPSANDVVVDPGAPRSQHTAINISPDPR